MREAPPVASIDPALLDENCPSRRVLRFLTHWTPLILYCLSAGVWKFSDLQRAIHDVSKKMLAQVLHELETDGLVQRTVYAGPLPATDYRLTERGMQLHEPLAMLCRWAESNAAILEAIEASRKARR